MKTTTTTMAAVLTGLALAAPVGAQDVGACAGGRTVGSLGISGFRCAGDCRMTRVGSGPEGYWLYSTEPEVLQLEPTSPLRGEVREGDRIVAVDGLLITTREGSRRLHRIDPGQEVTLRFRRDGRLRETTVQAAALCESRSRDDVVIRGVTSVGGRIDTVSLSGRVSVTSGLAAGRLATTAAPRAHLGMSFQCDDCTISTTAEGGVRWSFSRPVEIKAVERGGPADRAGLKAGDLLRAVDGHAIESREGGEAFGSLEPGEEVSFSVSRPDGSSGIVLVTPDPVDEPQVVGLRGARVVRAADEGERSGDEGPLRYTGTLGEAVVEVRGGPVRVVKQSAEGVLTIYVGDSLVRIRVPRGSGGS